MKKYILISITLLSGIVTQTSCESACDTLLLADLAFVAVSIAVPEVAVAEPLVMNTVLKHLEAECTAENAAPSKRGISIDYRPNSYATWTPALILDHGVPTYMVYADNEELTPGATDNRNDGFVFHTPGEYMISVWADAGSAVPERDEDNNAGGGKDGGVHRTSSPYPQGSEGLIVRVVDRRGKQATGIDQTQPLVGYLGAK